MASQGGFWSYVHADDDAENGRIAQLARDVKAQYELIKGEPIDLFLDQDAIQWGERWRDEIETSLADVAFFIPILTPRYFQSSECRREFQFIVRRMTALNIRDLIRPILYVDVPEMTTGLSPSDEMMATVIDLQWIPWDQLRFAERDSAEYRRAVARIAKELADANSRADEMESPGTDVLIGLAEVDDDEEEAGYVDKLAAGEEAMEGWSQSLAIIGEQLDIIGQVMVEGTQELERRDAQGGGFAARLAIARHLATELAEPVAMVQRAADEYAHQLHDVDEGVRIIIANVSAEAENDLEARRNVCEFFGTLRTLRGQTSQAMDSVEQMASTIRPMENISRDLRPPLRKLRQALTMTLEARELTEEWVRLIDASGVECER